MSSLIDDLLQGDDLQGDMRDRIIEVCGGNPLFVEEMLQMLRDDDELVHLRGERGEAAVELLVRAVGDDDAGDGAGHSSSR